MFPPETTHTTVRPPAFPASAAATGAAPAPSATMRARSARIRTAPATSSRDATSDPASSSRASANISGNTKAAPMPSTKLGVRVTVVGLPASSEGASGAAVATSAAYTRTHVPRARRQDPVRTLVRPGVNQPVRRAAALERADRLEVLELEPDLALRVDRQAHERRADRDAGDALAGCAYRVDRDPGRARAHGVYPPIVLMTRAASDSSNARIV